MKIALVHYHLKTGGVTTVLKHQVEVLQPVCEVIVLTGNRDGMKLPCQVIEIPDLGYDQPAGRPVAGERTAERVFAALQRVWPGGCDVLHIHNPLLAKNRGLLQIIERLRLAGINLFLQIHDFAEDGRPEAFYEEPYPRDCHYGVLNQRDADILLSAGLKRGGIHMIPNAVAVPSFDTSRRKKSEVLYPVRAIRRKNLGEAILLCTYLGDRRRLIVSQPPNSPSDTASYLDWVTWARAKHLPIEFEAGRNRGFCALMRDAESVITTSISEGFGLAFLESWTAGKHLWGRRIDAVCRDLEHHGLRLGFLYDRIDIPMAWIDGRLFRQRWQQTVRRAAGRYGRSVRADRIDRAFSRMTVGDRIDFGLLDETTQRRVLNRLVSKPFAGTELARMNPCLGHPGEVQDVSSLIETNRRVVLQHYGLDGYRSRLLGIYDRVINHPVIHCIDKKVLFEAFFDLNRFSLLQWGSYEG